MCVRKCVNELERKGRGSERKIKREKDREYYVGKE
jgi:hypothetical protein